MQPSSGTRALPAVHRGSMALLHVANAAAQHAALTAAAHPAHLSSAGAEAEPAGPGDGQLRGESIASSVAVVQTLEHKAAVGCRAIGTEGPTSVALVSLPAKSIC